SVSERRRRARADDLARNRADAAEAVGAAAFKVVGITGPQDAALGVDCNLQPPTDDDAPFLTIMHERHTTRVGPRFIAFFQDLQRPPDEIFSHLAIRDPALA